MISLPDARPPNLPLVRSPIHSRFAPFHSSFVRCRYRSVTRCYENFFLLSLGYRDNILLQKWRCLCWRKPDFREVKDLQIRLGNYVSPERWKERTSRMKRSAGHAILLSKRPLLRKFYYGFLGLFGLIVGLSFIYSAIKDHRASPDTPYSPILFIGIAFPFIIIGIELYRFWDGVKKIRCVQCKECKNEFPIKAMYKTGRCPSCNSKRVCGVLLDGGTTWVSLVVISSAVYFILYV